MGPGFSQQCMVGERQSQKLNLGVRLGARRNLGRQTDQNGISQAVEQAAQGDYTVSLGDFQESAA